MNKPYDIAVVGGGAAGMTAAIALSEKGFSVALIDAVPPATKKELANDGRTVAFALGTTQILDQFGLWSAISNNACPILDILVSDGKKSYAHYDHKLLGSSPMGFIIEVHKLMSFYYEKISAAKNITFIAPQKVLHFDPGTDYATLDLENGEKIRAHLVVAADGKRSYLRSQASLRTRGYAYKQTAIVCVVEAEEPHRNFAYESFLPTGPFAFLPMFNQRGSIVWSLETELAEAMKKTDDETFVALMQEAFGDYLGSLKLVSKRWYYPLDLVQAEKFYSRRLVLVGDAAHGIHPLAGQGLNLGLRDVNTLVDLLHRARGLGLDIGYGPHLKDYERNRRADTLNLILSTDGLNRLFSNNYLVPKIARRAGLNIVNKATPIKKFFMKRAMGL